ncbi:MAG: hypothetical protein GY832_33595, partial [Chloroflexi bacterium]|nr:hypothetical protein [Chloroflexota bacterium]
LILLVTLLVSACSPGVSGANQTVEPPVAQAAEISAGESQDEQPAAEQQPPAGEEPGQAQPPDGRTPPQEAIEACNVKSEGDVCEFTAQRGAETGVCETVQEQLACSPQREQPGEGQAGENQPPAPQDEQPAAEQQAPAGEEPGQAQPPDGRTPPQEAIEACNVKSEGDVCEFTAQRGAETGICETVQEQLACSPQRERSGEGQDQTGGNQAPGERPGGEAAAHNIEQALSDRAQSTTISFDALAFLTGNLGADSFYPPGKVADFWGFQYLRDNDPTEMGHNTDFLTSAALNVLYILTPSQRAELVTLAEGQVDSINEYGYNRFVLIDAFRRLLEGDLPAGSTGLDEQAVQAYSAELYRLDGEISFERAQVMGRLLSSLDATQLAHLDGMVGQGMLEWPDVEEPSDLRSLDRDVKVAVMTYAGDMFSWYAGSVEADVYFCPERQGTYFGSFYLKDAPAMGNPDYTISSSLTGDMGDTMLGFLSADQAQLVTGLVDVQRPYLLGIVDARQAVSEQLRRFMAGESPDSATVLNLMEEYGELDGAIVYNFATSFAQLDQSLSDEQRAQLMALRAEMLGNMIYPTGAYLYSEPVAMPEVPNTDFLFTP